MALHIETSLKRSCVTDFFSHYFTMNQHFRLHSNCENAIGCTDNLFSQ